MEIEKTLTVSAPRERVWAMLLDPNVMGGAVPGMKSIEVISPTEYVAVMHQKIAFISAKFKLRTTITEQRAPEYLRAEGTGEDASVASSLKQVSEVFLASLPNAETELRIKVHVDLLGRLGTFGLSVMKTKADRLWEEFGANLTARLEGEKAPSNAPTVVTSDMSAATSVAQRAPEPTVEVAEPAKPQTMASSPAQEQSPFSTAPTAQPLVCESSMPKESGWWARLVGQRTVRTTPARTQSGVIRVEVRELNRTVTVEWPAAESEACRQWLREVMS